MLGRSAGLTEEQLRHIGDDPLPDGVYSAGQAAIVQYAQRSTRMEVITDDLYQRLSEHFDARGIIEICFTVGLSNLINRFHATFLTDVDPETNAAVAPSCPTPMPESLRSRAEKHRGSAQPDR